MGRAITKEKIKLYNNTMKSLWTKEENVKFQLESKLATVNGLFMGQQPLEAAAATLITELQSV